MAEIPNIRPNSNKYQLEQKKTEEEHRYDKIAKGPVKKKQTSAFQKFAKGFIPEDAKSIKEYVADEAPGLVQSFLRRLLQNLLDTYLPENGKYSRGGGRSIFGTNSNVRYAIFSNAADNFGR